MNLTKIIPFAFTVFLVTQISAQDPQGLFLESWEPRTITNPDYTDVSPITQEVTVSITVDFADTITKISKYLFGDNANLWTGTMSDKITLMKNIAAREPGVLRGPGGSISDVFFWNRNADQRPPDVPQTMAGSSEVNWPWYGDRPHAWESWTMDVDSFYTILGKTEATGMITVNYGYARYGTGPNPVANAAHMAAEWVRYDNGRSKFWEIGNEVFGSWEAGYKIDRTLNKDGQPEIITPTLYGQHCNIFIDSMKAAALETGHDIKIGVVMVEASSTGPGWNSAVASQVGNKADFYVIHSYFTPYNANSNSETILGSYTNTERYKSYVENAVTNAGKPQLPVALTEYNIFATGSNQAVSHINGMHAVLVTGETMKTGYGAALRWDLANGWDNGNDHGMFAYNEPGIPNYTPHPAFYHLYYMRRFCGDVLLNSTTSGASGVVITPTAFSSGQMGATLVNTSGTFKIIRLNIRNFRFGDRFYTFTLTGIPGEEFSRKVFVNGTGNALVAGGPDNHETIKAEARLITNEIRIMIPALSAVYLLAEPGTKDLPINNDVSVNSTREYDEIGIYPNPSAGEFTVNNIPADISSIEIRDVKGESLYLKTDLQVTSHKINKDLKPGLYFVILSGRDYYVARKLVIR